MNPPPVEVIKIASGKFEDQIASLLGFESGVGHALFRSSWGRTSDYHIAAEYHPRDDGGIDHVLCYSDVVQPTQFGSQLVSILDAFIIEPGGAKAYSRTMYKNISKTHIDGISIKLRDQHGRPILFAKND